ncbi:MAG: LysR family transcriptional regulator substrate-binding protein, partial [Vulcanimicrobiaceae bacterium]
ELDAKILERHRRGVRLTDFGSAIIQAARAMLADEERIRQAADAHRGLRTGRLRFGTVNAGSNTLLPEVLPQYSKRYPGIEVRVTETGSLDIARDVLRGDLDLGLIVRVPEIAPLEDGLFAEDLLRSKLVVCAPAQHTLGKRRRLTSSDVFKEPLILFRSGYLMHEILRRLLGERTGNVVYYTDNTESAKRMVAAGVGMTMLPEFSIVDDSYRREGKITYIPLETDFPALRLALVYRAGDYLTRAAEAFRQMLRDAAATRTR